MNFVWTVKQVVKMANVLKFWCENKLVEEQEYFWRVAPMLVLDGELPIFSTELWKTVADLRGGARPLRPPSGPKFLYFHAVFGKNWPNNRLAPSPLGLAPPPLGNPGSATGKRPEKMSGSSTFPCSHLSIIKPEIETFRKIKEQAKIYIFQNGDKSKDQVADAGFLRRGINL